MSLKKLVFLGLLVLAGAVFSLRSADAASIRTELNFFGECSGQADCNRIFGRLDLRGEYDGGSITRDNFIRGFFDLFGGIFEQQFFLEKDLDIISGQDLFSEDATLVLADATRAFELNTPPIAGDGRWFISFIGRTGDRIEEVGFGGYFEIHTVSEVPIPATLPLTLLGVLALGTIAGRNRKNASQSRPE